MLCVLTWPCFPYEQRAAPSSAGSRVLGVQHMLHPLCAAAGMWVAEGNAATSVARSHRMLWEGQEFPLRAVQLGSSPRDAALILRVSCLQVTLMWLLVMDSVKSW